MEEPTKKRILKAVPLTSENYKAYGQVIESGNTSKSETVNLGTAQRFNFLANVCNTRPNAKPNICVFSCSPVAMPFTLKVLEKHPYSNQIFSPMNASRYLVVVALGGDLPDLNTLAAFVASGTQAINYNPGVWHHPMIALDKQTDFFCLVHEDGSDDDCHAILADMEELIVTL